MGKGVEDIGGDKVVVITVISCGAAVIAGGVLQSMLSKSTQLRLPG